MAAWRHHLALVRPPRHDAASLIAQIARGEASALTALYDETASCVHGLVLRVLSDAAAAEEVTADVFVHVWRHAGAYDPARGKALAWLLLLARSRALDRLRSGMVRRARTEPLEAAVMLPTLDAGPLADAEHAERRRLVVRALSTLPREQRHALELAYDRGMSHAEIAEATGQPLGTIKTRIRTAMTRLRDVLAPVDRAAS